MLTTVPDVAMFMLALAAAIAFVRLLKGPSLPDRVVAMDLLGTLTVGLLVVGAAASAQRAFLDAAIIIALIGFVSNIAYARFIERRGH
jgi:multicomponent Na+:H+ antiporter subunit F